MSQTGEAVAADYAAAGVTWWLEGFDVDDPVERVLATIKRGPGNGRAD